MAMNGIIQKILEYDLGGVPELVQEELDAGTEISQILNEGLIVAMDEVGKQFGESKIFLPEMLASARAMKAGLEVLRPLLSGFRTESKGTIVIGTVKGDLHDIGKNLVIMMLEGAGFTVVDLGVGVNAEKFVEAGEKNGADIVALSALLTTTMPEMETAVLMLKEKAPYQKIMVGGAPVTESFAKEIGADGYGTDAAEAVRIARLLMNSQTTSF